MLCLAALASLPLLFSPQAREHVAAGQPMPEVELRTVLGGDGRTKLSQFRGQPVLIAWYSTVFAGTEGARAAVSLAEEVNQEFHESQLVVFLMEIKNNDVTYLRALQMAELPGAPCRLLRNQELHVTFDDTTGPPPKMILIGADGVLLYAGSYQRSNEVKKLVKAELAKMEKGWGADPLAVQARALAWGQRKLGKARALLEPALGGGASELTALAAEIDGRFEALRGSVAFHLEQGEPGRAALAMGNLSVAAEGHAAWQAGAEEALARLTGVAPEAELEKKLDSILRPTLKAKPKKGLDAKLRSFAEKDAAGTKVGARAARLADAVAKVEGL